MTTTKPILLALALLAGIPVSAHPDRESTTPTIVLSTIAGALIGGHNHDRWVQGAVIGAAAGSLLAREQPERVVVYPYYRPMPTPTRVYYYVPEPRYGRPIREYYSYEEYRRHRDNPNPRHQR